MTKNTFKKEEKLCSKVLFDKAFSGKNNFTNFPIRAVWCIADYESNYPCKIAIAVPKKKFKRAVDRNRIKRLIREAFRLNKHDFYNTLFENDKKIALILIYNSTKMPNYKEVEDKIILSLQRLQKEIEK